MNIIEGIIALRKRSSCQEKIILSAKDSKGFVGEFS